MSCPITSARRSYLTPGDLVEFNPVFQKDKSAFHAKEIVSSVADYVSDIDDDYREVCTLTSWIGDSKKSGFLDREHIGDVSLKFHITDVFTEGVETLNPGSKVYCGLRRDPDYPFKLLATNIEIVKMDL